MELNQYLSMFIDESKDHLQSLNENLLVLENDPKDISIVHNIFRSAHTLKGMSATMGFEDIASLTHEMENVLDLVRNSKLDMDPFIFDCIFKSLDALEAMVDDIVQGGTGKANVSDIVTSLQSIVTGDYQVEQSVGVASDSVPVSSGGTFADQADLTKVLDEYQYSVLLQSFDSSFNVYHIDVTVNEDCVLKAARAYMVFNLLENSGEVVKAHPAVEDLEQGKFEHSFSLYYVSEMDSETLEKTILSVSEIASASVMELDRASLDDLIAMTAEATLKAAQLEVAATLVAEAPVKAASVKSSDSKPVASSAPSGGAVASRTIRVDIERLDTLMNLFSELLIDRVRLEQLASEIDKNELTETVEHMARVSSDLQNIVLKLRMVPVESVFNRFPRMIRDLAKSLDKKVDLIVTGADTELDRTVIDEIGDPLVHLLRNAVDHGVETVSKRIESGKSDTGKVHLSAYHSGNHVYIEVQDDGDGVNREVVLGKAIKNGLVTPEQGARMSDLEVYQLLFASGFSTASVISDISGRGVGLDVVKTKIQSLGGTVLVESEPGQGTKFSVQLPLTLSIIAAMLIRLGHEKYAIPLSSIVETATVKLDQLRHVHGNVMMDYRSTVIPVITLGKIFEVPGYEIDSKVESDVVIIRKGDKLSAILVDELIGQQEIVLKSLGKYLTKMFAVSGATILGDGHVALIIDTNALLK
ncbi:chemotaxis protein CheA [Paenibacillus sp. N1-5-1-14]|uniref:chemotaxis protein CheA n=1 Tax=Paenibacillus radicibacter TaxID=2972488 RepID=UPI0021597BDA|nr:chemotaxis protein CheA [Paenibacillus radicibacter]MCR8642171.1 chemotaxis protein CheA [Paenibacillus radicibacter]